MYTYTYTRPIDDVAMWCNILSGGKQRGFPAERRRSVDSNAGGNYARRILSGMIYERYVPIPKLRIVTDVIARKTLTLH